MAKAGEKLPQCMKVLFGPCSEPKTAVTLGIAATRFGSIGVGDMCSALPMASGQLKFFSKYFAHESRILREQRVRCVKNFLNNGRSFS